MMLREQLNMADQFAQARPLKVGPISEGFTYCEACNGSGVQFDPHRCCDECRGMGCVLLPELRQS